MDIALVNPPASTSNDTLFYSLLSAQTMIRDKGYVQAVIPLQLATSPSFMDRIDDLGLEVIDNTQEISRRSPIKGVKGPKVLIVLFQKKWDLSFGRLQFALANFANLYDMMIAENFKGGIYVTGCLCPSQPSPTTLSQKEGILTRMKYLQEVADNTLEAEQEDEKTEELVHHPNAHDPHDAEGFGLRTIDETHEESSSAEQEEPVPRGMMETPENSDGHSEEAKPDGTEEIEQRHRHRQQDDSTPGASPTTRLTQDRKPGQVVATGDPDRLKGPETKSKDFKQMKDPPWAGEYKDFSVMKDPPWGQ